MIFQVDGFDEADIQTSIISFLRDAKNNTENGLWLIQLKP